MQKQPSPTILIVEDQTLVRMHGTGLLQDAGFTVLEAGSADEALEILKTHPDVQVLFSDIDMPGSMDGLELATLVHNRWPNMKLLMTSGDHKIEDSMVPDGGRFLAKPWSEAMLIEKIRKVLAG